MSDPYERAKGGRLTFKGGSLATRSKPIDKKNKKKKNKNKDTQETRDDSVIGINPDDDSAAASTAAAVSGDVGGGGEVVYTIDAAKRMKYEQLFPVEAKRFQYDPVNVDVKLKTVEDALDDRVKKKADRYCK